MLCTGAACLYCYVLLLRGTNRCMEEQIYAVCSWCCYSWPPLHWNCELSLLLPNAPHVIHTSTVCIRRPPERINTLCICNLYWHHDDYMNHVPTHVSTSCWTVTLYSARAPQPMWWNLQSFQTTMTQTSFQTSSTPRHGQAQYTCDGKSIVKKQLSWLELVFHDLQQYATQTCIQQHNTTTTKQHNRTTTRNTNIHTTQQQEARPTCTQFYTS